MDALIGLVWIVGLAYALLRLLSWAYHCWDRGWWFQNPRTMKIRQPQPLFRQLQASTWDSAGFAVYSQWKAINPSSHLSFQDWKKQHENEEFWREFWREQDDRDYWDRVTGTGTYAFLNDDER
jgi:hypothetical protein